MYGMTEDECAKFYDGFVFPSDQAVCLPASSYGSSFVVEFHFIPECTHILCSRQNFHSGVVVTHPFSLNDGHMQQKSFGILFDHVFHLHKERGIEPSNCKQNTAL